jgi:hypothetical protein
MKIKSGVAIIFLTIFTSAYADDPSSVKQGAEEYDWQTCLTNKANSCINNCATSSDIGCQDDCNAVANDKCLSLGLTPPQ